MNNKLLNNLKQWIKLTARYLFNIWRSRNEHEFLFKRKTKVAVPGAPTISGLTVLGSNAIRIAWGVVATAVGYNIYKSLDDITYVKIATTLNTSFESLDLSGNTQYYFKVSAYNIDGEGSLSSSSNATTSAVSTKYVWIQKFGEGSFDINTYIPNVSYSHYGIYTNAPVLVSNSIEADVDITASENLAGQYIKQFDGVGAVEILLDGAVIFGDGTVEGDWRIIRSGNNLLIQRYESSSWVTKSTISA